MRELKQGDIVEVDVDSDKSFDRKRIFHSYNNGGINYINPYSESNYKSNEFYGIQSIRDGFWRKKQLISDEVREKLKKAIDDSINLKFKIESLEQQNELENIISGEDGAWKCYYDSMFYTKENGLYYSIQINENKPVEFDLKTGELKTSVPSWWKVGSYAYDTKGGNYFKIDKHDAYFKEYKHAKLVPFTFKDMMEIKPFAFKKKGLNVIYYISEIKNNSVKVTGYNYCYSWIYLLDKYEQLDGTPCGKFEVV